MGEDTIREVYQTLKNDLYHDQVSEMKQAIQDVKNTALNTILL